LQDELADAFVPFVVADGYSVPGFALCAVASREDVMLEAVCEQRLGRR
jgi:hypothetical protein